MNHDIMHCIDYTDDCPTHCELAKLQRDLKNVQDGYIQISYAHFLHSWMCPIYCPQTAPWTPWKRGEQE